jgi:hypothetical protein
MGHHRRQDRTGMTSLVHGLTAGAVGTAVLNTVTYLDMAVRGRPSSEVPAETVGALADIAGVGALRSGPRQRDGLGAPGRGRARRGGRRLGAGRR